MFRRPWLLVVVLLGVGAVIGAAAIIASTVSNRLTGSEAFCSTSCHTMKMQAQNPAYGNSPHRANAFGVLAGCSDCHIPTNNWFIETYTHVTSGIRDVIAEMTGGFSDPAVWAKRRIELRQEVLADMRRQKSVTCRKCHEAAAIQPPSEAGRQSHALLLAGQATCVDCHLNTFHGQIAPSASLRRLPASPIGRRDGHEQASTR
ncbi:MAG: NapC/NirT family cytochrome c [Alphaproteobacteria bacterium]|nr:NapC/NirT family cytochrome c [Alphaproteobacteria bacterium]